VSLTVVVVSYNVAPLLDRCLRSVDAALGEIGGGSVAVVDNASADESASLVRRSHPTVELSVNPENVGFGAACNQGLARATGDSVLFLNPDAELRPGALRALCARLESAPRAALVGPRVTYPDGRAQPTRRRFPTLPVLLVEATPLEWRGPRWPALARYYRDDATPVASSEEWVSGACLMGRAAPLRAVGGFDPAFFMYFEEVDLSRRLAARGWETWYEPAADLTHHHGRSADQDVTARDRHYYRSKYRYAARYFGRRTARLLRLSATALFAAEGALQRRRGDAILARRYGALVRWHAGPER
jgi:N-acetylglucosaminyl-diphospho-decaprenol L-rhamnosyltransferase